MTSASLTFDEWAAALGPEITRDILWRSFAYRSSLYAFHVGWHDALALSRNPITRRVAGQLYDALGSIAANVSEGFSRSSGPDRARLLEYGLGSTREGVVWYQGSIPILGQATVSARQSALQDIARSLLGTIPKERARTIRKW
jgi:four helix bundle protein